MDNVKTSWWQRNKPTTRRLIQLYSALLHNAHLKGFISGQIYKGKAKYACVPGFNCYSCPSATGACPLGSIQNALASTGHSAGWYVLGIILLFGVLLGRTICGWLCPLGLIQELLNKIPTPKLKKNCVTRALSWLKYMLLAVFVIALPLLYGLRYDLPLPGFCKYICPAGTFEGAMGLLSNTAPVNTGYFSMLGILFTRKFVIMLVTALACVFCYRSFCRFICPLGAIYGLFNRFNIIGVKVDRSRCSHCGACVRSCGMDVRHVGDHECINCGKCMDICNQGAIAIKAGKIILKAPAKGCADDGPDAPQKRRKLGRVLWGIALAILCFALLWFNVLDPTVKKESIPIAGSSAALELDAGIEPAATEASVAAEASDTVETSTATEAPDIAEIPTDAEMSAAGDTSAEAEASDTVETSTATEAPDIAEIPTDAEMSAAGDTSAEAEASDAAEISMDEESSTTTQEASSVSWDSDAPVGREVGQQLPDFILPCYDGTEFHLAEQRGKIVFINLWATSCTPCKNELPFFNDLYVAHEGDIAMLVVHSSMVMDDPAEYLADKGYAMPFATDDDDDTVAEIVGSTNTFPQTIVLNRRGEVVYNKIGSITPEMLSALYDEAD